MPKKFINKLAKQAGVKPSEVENVETLLKKEYGENYKAIIGTLKKVFAADSNREKTPFGHLKIENCIITAESVDDYLGSELASDAGLDPDKIYKVYRPLSEIKKGLDSYNLVPLTDEHWFVDGRAVHKDKWIGGSGSDARIKDGNVAMTLGVWDSAGVKSVEEHKQCLSAGYSYRLVKEPGTWNGKAYDFKMVDIVCNHIALVKKGRVDVAKMGDSLINFIKDNEMDPKELLAILTKKHPTLVKDAAEELEKITKDKKGKDNVSTEQTGKGGSTDSEPDPDDKTKDKKGKDKKGKDKKSKDKKSSDTEDPEKSEKEEMTGDTVQKLVQAQLTQINQTRDLCERVIGKAKFAADATPELMLDATLKAKGIKFEGKSMDAKVAMLEVLADSQPVTKPVKATVAADSAGDGFNIISI